LAQLHGLAERVRREMEGVSGVVDLSVEQRGELPTVTVRFRRNAIARYGLTIQQVAHEIETAFQGRTVARIVDGPIGYDLVVRYDTSDVGSLEAVREARIGVPGGARLPLHVFADVARSLGPSMIARENVERKIVVQCNVAGRDLQSVVDDIRAQVERGVTMPEGFRVEYGGQFESAQEASRILLVVGSVVVLVIFLLLFVALGTLRDAGLVILNLPLALIGGVVGVYASGGVVSVASLIGFITLFGIATRNGIMMVTHFHHLRDHEGVTDPLEIVRRGAMERLSPILMTALASGLGLLPLALSGGSPGSEIQAPMAIVILFGLLSSTVLNMVVVPSLYLRFGAAARRV
jgi:Cu/Ag efflux pump CusA